MSEIKNRIKSDIIAARKKQDKKTIEVLAFVLDRIQETEREEYKNSRRPGSEYQPTFEEISSRAKALRLEEEARVVKNVIRHYEEDIANFEKLKFMSEANVRRGIVSKLNGYFSDLRKDPDQLDECLLDLCLIHDIRSFDDIPKAMKITEVELYFEDQSVVYTKLKALLR